MFRYSLLWRDNFPLLFAALLSLVVLASLPCSSISSSPKSSQQHYFYIYDDEPWHKISLLSMNMREDPNELLELTTNHGAGALIDSARGLYHTDQYQLFLINFYRAQRDWRRTYNASLATTFIIPYDLASDVAYYKHCAKQTSGQQKSVCFDFRKCPNAETVTKLLYESPYFRRRGGYDHVLYVGNNYAMEHYLGKPKCKAFLSGVCENCTKYSIDDYSFLHSGNEGILTKGRNWHAVPFPADFHWTRNVTIPYPWSKSIDHRPILCSYTGTTMSYYRPAKKLRESIVHYCEKHTDLCVHQSYGTNGTRSSLLVEGFDPTLISQRSVFCFQPIGDLMTRKGLFDSLLQGCIPVVFDDLTAKVMYTWHWEEAFWKEILIELPFHPTAHRYFDPVAYLQSLYTNTTHMQTVLRRKQELIQDRVFELQYSLEGRHEVEGLDHHLGHVGHGQHLGAVHNDEGGSGMVNGEDGKPTATIGTVIEGSENEGAATMLIGDGIPGGGGHNAHVGGHAGGKHGGAAPGHAVHPNAGHVGKKHPGVLHKKHPPRSRAGGMVLSTWPRNARGEPMRDAFDIIIDLSLGFHSGTIADVRNGTVPECWNGYLDTKLNKCMPGEDPSTKKNS